MQTTRKKIRSGSGCLVAVTAGGGGEMVAALEVSNGADAAAFSLGSW
jgi:hypothetical protein